MSLLLAPDAVTLYAVTTTEDTHGWASNVAEVLLWSGNGSCQETVPMWDGLAAERAGAGPYDPTTQASCDLYLPEDCGVQAGNIAQAHGIRWLVQRVRLVPDPTGGAVGCVVAGCVEYVDEGSGD